MAKKRQKVAIAILAIMVMALAGGVFWLLQLAKGEKEVQLTDFSTTQRFVVEAPSWPFRNDVLFVEAIGQLSAPIRMTIKADGREMREMRDRLAQEMRE